MKRPIEFAALLACALLLAPQHSQDTRSAFDKCRTVVPADIRDSNAPTFHDYQVPIAPPPADPKLDLQSSPTARMYRTVLRQEIAKGPNFAGHYRVAIWGCGSSCADFAVINLETGRVIELADVHAITNTYFDVDAKFFPDSESDDTFGFRKDSRLLILLGDLNEDENREGVFYYILENEKLRLVHSTPVHKNCESLRTKK